MHRVKQKWLEEKIKTVVFCKGGEKEQQQIWSADVYAGFRLATLERAGKSRIIKLFLIGPYFPEKPCLSLEKKSFRFNPSMIYQTLPKFPSSENLNEKVQDQTLMELGWSSYNGLLQDRWRISPII